MTRYFASLFLAAVIATALIAGCASTVPDSAPSLPIVGDDIAAAVAHIDSADAAVKTAVPHTDEAGKVSLTVAQAEHVAAKTKATEARESLSKGEAECRALAVDRDAWKAKYQTIYNSPVERAWRLANLLFWLAVGLFAAANIAAVVLPLVFPGWGLIASKAIIRFLPFMNGASFVRDKLAAGKAEPDALPK